MTTTQDPQALLTQIVLSAKSAGAVEAGFQALSADDSETTAAAQHVLRRRHEELEQSVDYGVAALTLGLPRTVSPQDLQPGDVAVTWDPAKATVQGGVVESLERIGERVFVHFKTDIDPTPEPWDDTAHKAVWILIHRPQETPA